MADAKAITLTYWRAANNFGDPYCMNGNLQMLYTSEIALVMKMVRAGCSRVPP
jgi:hypothetical protein